MISRKGSSNGISLGFLVFIVFLVLKLTGVIAWSWWWVTCPLWIGLAIVLAILAVMVIGGGSVLGLAALFGKK